MPIPHNGNNTVLVSSIIQYVVSGITALVVALCFWILNSISRRVSESAESAEKAHKRIDDMQKDRTDKWLNKEKECGEEKERIGKLEAINQLKK